jgi:hypothetical protein
LTANQKETKPAFAKVLNNYTVAVSINAKNGLCDIPKQANEHYTTVASPTVVMYCCCQYISTQNSNLHPTMVFTICHLSNYGGLIKMIIRNQLFLVSELMAGNTLKPLTSLRPAIYPK